MTRKEMDEYNKAQDKYVAGLATSQAVLIVLRLRRKWEYEQSQHKGGKS